MAFYDPTRLVLNASAQLQKCYIGSPTPTIFDFGKRRLRALRKRSMARRLRNRSDGRGGGVLGCQLGVLGQAG